MCVCVCVHVCEYTYIHVFMSVLLYQGVPVFNNNNILWSSSCGPMYVARFAKTDAQKQNHTYTFHQYSISMITKSINFIIIHALAEEGD